LIQKSRYFANLFNSGMIETRQNIIEIQDCDSNVFQEFLRWIYCGKIQDLNDDLAFKLQSFADKYLQNDLNQKCIDYLTLPMDPKNVYKILDFACRQNNHEVLNLCTTFLVQTTNLENISQVIEYLNRSQHPNFAAYDHRLRDKAFDLALDAYLNSSKQQNRDLQFYEDFLITNLAINNIQMFLRFFWVDGSKSFNPFQIRNEPSEDDKNCLVQCARKLRNPVFNFVKENIKEVTETTSIFIPDFFWRDFTLFITKKLKASESNNARLQERLDGELKISDQSSEEQLSGENEEKKGKSRIKRKEKIQDDSLEGNPELKKTKKTIL